VRALWDYASTYPKRRAVLKGLLQGAAALGAAPALLTTTARFQAAGTTPEIKQYRLLGTTDMRISDISFGASQLGHDLVLVSYAFDRGINYFDTAESYTGGNSEESIGKALQGKRDKVFLASKGGFGAGTRADDMMHTLEASLRRLRTDYIDIYFIHAVNNVQRLQNPEFYTFTERAKSQGKMRYVGLSGHGGNLIECLTYAIDRGAYDVMLVAYNFGQDPSFIQRFTRHFDFIAINQELPATIKKAKAAGMGVIAMKTLRGARLSDMKPYQQDDATFSQAALRWVLSNPSVDALIVSMRSEAEVDEFVAASGHTKVTRHDLNLLYQYTALHDATYCRPVCQACVSACPEHVPIADVLRYKMYYSDYGAQDMARTRYAALKTPAATCLTCENQPCLNACPYGLTIPDLTRQAHRLLHVDV
jgi:predicted aldo/keto reductase-like oxidoreductase